MLIQKDNKKINVSPKAFRLLYREQGYEEVSMDNAQEDGDTEKTLRKMKVEDLKNLAREKGVEGYEDLKKEELIQLLKDVV